jgi:hypothetical protein
VQVDAAAADIVVTREVASDATTMNAGDAAVATMLASADVDSSTSALANPRVGSAAAATTTSTDSIGEPRTHAIIYTSARRAAATMAIIARCDNNSLSLILAFLNMKDFHSSMKVNRQWRSVSQVNTAWPKFDLRRFIRQLQADDYDNPLHRRLHVHARHLSRMLRHPTYQKCSDVVLKSDVASESESLSHLSQLQHLTAVNLTLASQVEASLNKFAMQVRDRLQSIVLAYTSETPEEAIPFSSLGLLHRLRVLVINFLPPLGQLVRLHQLEYLHIEHI